MPYQSRYAGTIADLMGAETRARAEATRRDGEILGNAVAGIGGTIGDLMHRREVEQKQRPIEAQQSRMRNQAEQLGAVNLAGAQQKLQDTDQQRQQQQQAMQIVDAVRRGQGRDVLDAIQDPQVRTMAEDFLSKRDQRLNQDRKERAQLAQAMGYGGSAVQALVMLDDNPSAWDQFQEQTGGDPNAVKQYVDAWAKFGEKQTTEKYATRPADADIYDQTTGQVVSAGTPKPPPPAPGFNLSPGQTRFGPDGKPVASLPAQRPNEAQEPLVAIMGPDGQPVLVPRSQAAGKRPATSREQGRPVTSGDAGRIADLDTSLNDLATLTTELSGAKSTGTKAKVGTMLPNAVTELTGWGADAKSKQAVIERVKQVIGKSLEQGVLRKEDEYKYAKILPTIGDVKSVVDVKLAGLKKAIAQRKQTTLEALADAGYDTGRFTQRTSGPQKIGRFTVETEGP